MARHATPPPERWAQLHEDEEAARRAEPGVQPEPDEDPPIRRVFLVVGPRAVFGAQTGDTVTADLTEAQAAALIEAGHIVPAADPGPEPVTTKE